MENILDIMTTTLNDAYTINNHLFKLGVATITCPKMEINEKNEKVVIHPDGHSNININDCRNYWNYINDLFFTNIILCGDRSNIMCLDIDVPKEGENVEDGMKWLEENKDKLGNTWVEKTIRGGFHYYYKYNPNVKSTNKGWIDGKKYSIDLLGNGRFTYCSPTMMNGKGCYDWLEGQSPLDCDLQEMPDWLVQVWDKKHNNKNKNNEKKKKEKKEVRYTDEQYEKLFDLCGDYCDDLSKENVKNYNPDGSIVFKRVQSSYCELCDRDHDNDNTNIGVFKNNHYLLGCTRANGLHKYVDLEKTVVVDLAELTNDYIEDDDDDDETMYYFNDYQKEVLNKTFNSLKELKKTFYKIMKKTTAYVKMGDGTGCWTIFNIDKKKQYSNNDKGVWTLCATGKMPFENFEVGMYIDDTNIKTIKLNKLFEFMPNHKIYNGVKFDPEYKYVGNFNLFNGFKAQPSKTYDYEKIRIIDEHMKHVLAGGDEEVYQYIKHYYFNIYSKPYEKIPTALVFSSKQGTGKSLFNYMFGKQVLGDKYFNVYSSIEELLERFNQNQATTLFYILEEATFAGDAKQANRLKQFITQTQQSIEIKGGVKYVVEKFGGCVFNSNSENPIRLEENNRRYQLIRCSDEKIGNTKYFDELKNAFLDDDVVNQFIAYLYDTCSNDYNLNKLIETDISKMNMELCKEPIDTFFDENPENYENNKKYQSSLVFQRFKTYCSDENIDYKYINNKKFTQVIKKKYGDVKKSNYSYYIFDRLKIKEDDNIEDVEEGDDFL